MFSLFSKKSSHSKTEVATNTKVIALTASLGFSGFYLNNKDKSNCSNLTMGFLLSTIGFILSQSILTASSKQHETPVDANKMSEKNEIIIPEAYRCGITLEIMKKPVICILDGKSYEESVISEWLTDHGTSPYNRAALNTNQSVKDVLVVNRNLEEAIEEFAKTNPTLFQEESFNAPSVKK